MCDCSLLNLTSQIWQRIKVHIKLFSKCTKLGNLGGGPEILFLNYYVHNGKFGISLNSILHHFETTENEKFGYALNAILNRSQNVQSGKFHGSLTLVLNYSQNIQNNRRGLWKQTGMGNYSKLFSMDCSAT
jgi:hypothetical protein